MTRGALDADEPRRLCPADALPDLLNARAREILGRQQPEPGVPAGNTEDFPLTQRRRKTEAIKLRTSGSSDPKQWVSWQTFHFTQGETELRWEMWPDPGPRMGGCNLNPSAGLLTPSGKSYHAVSGTCVCECVCTHSTGACTLEPRPRSLFPSPTLLSQAHFTQAKTHRELGTLKHHWAKATGDGDGAVRGPF